MKHIVHTFIMFCQSMNNKKIRSEKKIRPEDIPIESVRGDKYDKGYSVGFRLASYDNVANNNHKCNDTINDILCSLRDYTEVGKKHKPKNDNSGGTGNKNNDSLWFHWTMLF